MSLFGQTPRLGLTAHLPAAAALAQWADRHSAQANSGLLDSQTLANGLTLARARKTEMRALMERNPEEFVRQAMSAANRDRLPANLQPLVERRVKQRGFFGVYCQGFRPDQPVTNRQALHGEYGYEVRLNGVTHQAFVFGKWKDQQTVLDAVIEGVMLDEAIAIGDAPTPTEQVASGGVVVFASPTVSGPNTMLYMIAKFSDQAADPIDEATVLNQMGVVSEFWKNNSSGTVYLKGLVNGTQVVDIVHITLPQASTTTATNYNLYFYQLLSDARTAALAQGYNYDDYNLDVVVTTSDGFSYAGRANVGSQGAHLVTPYTTLRTVGHEMGHNLGLQHANYWRSDSTHPFGKDTHPGGYVADVNNGEWVEYGDYYSVMGAQSGGEWDDATKPHYNVAEKVHLGWLSGNEVRYVTNSGTYRLYRLDARTTVGTPRGLRIETLASDYTGYGRRYWLGYRYAAWSTAQNWCQNGVEVNVCQSYYGNDGAIRLDLTPYSQDQSSPFFDVNYKPGGWWTIDNSDKLDSTLIVGRTYDDAAAGIHITPVAKGSNGAGEEYLDVVINLGTFAENHAPVMAGFTASTNQVAVGQAVNFAIAASDSDGDALAYSWDFDDGQTWTASGLNSPTAAKSWSSLGQHRVTARVSDMKGGIATASLVVTVGASASTNEIRGRVLWAGQPVYGVRVFTSSGRQAWTDSDGSYVLPGLASNLSLTLNCAAAGLTFTAQFPNPITLASGDVYGADFYASELLPVIGGFAISGRVTDPNGGVAGVELGCGGILATTDASGNYQFTNIPNGTYTVIPSKDDWRFSPASKTVTINSNDFSGNNFARATPNTISGKFSGISILDTAPTVYLSNGQFVRATWQGKGQNWYWGYTLNVPAGQYSVSAALAGYALKPLTFTNPLIIAGNLTSQNFTGAVASAVGAITGRITQLGQPVVNAALLASQNGVTIAAVTTDSDGYYRIDNLTNGAYTVAASKAGLTFSPASIGIASVPSSGNFAAAGPFEPPVISHVSANPSGVSSRAEVTTLAVTASGTEPLVYSWRAIAAPAPVTFSANDSSSAAATTVGFQAAGSYTFRVAVTDSNYFRTTSNIFVTVSAGTGTMAVTPYQSQVLVGQALAFRADAWDSLGNRITVAPSWSAGGGGGLEMNGLFTATTPGGPYPVMATAGSLSATGFVWVAGSASAIPPAFTTQPLSQAVAAGSEVVFNSAATGSSPLVFQWQRNSNTIAGATASSYTITNVQPADAGVYTVVVSNTVDSVTSAAATLNVNSQPSLTAIASRTVHAGSTVTISNAATDADLPLQQLTFSLDGGAPLDASIGPVDGVFVWRTTAAQADTTNQVAVRVTDNGNPALADAQSFVITVAAPLRFQFAGISNGQFALSWNAVWGTAYRVQWADDLVSNHWTSLEPDIVATGWTASVSEPMSADQRFYRILIVE